jgi:hypothetical protein
MGGVAASFGVEVWAQRELVATMENTMAQRRLFMTAPAYTEVPVCEPSLRFMREASASREAIAHLIDMALACGAGNRLSMFHIPDDNCLMCKS